MSRIDLTNGVALSIRIKIADSCRLIFKNATKELEVESNLSRDQLKSEREDLRRDLDEFRKGFSAPSPRLLPDVGKALSRLHLRGRIILHHLFDDHEKLVEARDMCREACPNWEQPGWDPDSLAPRLIEVRTAVEYGIPIDILPLLDPIKPSPVENLDDLARVAGSLLGFSGIVRRTFGDVPDERRLRIDNTGSFPLKMFWDVNLSGARSARQFFEENSAHFDFKGGPWPNGRESRDEETFCEEVAAYLADPQSSFDGASGHQSDQLCYFFCHCDTEKKAPGNYVLYLQGPRSRRHAVSLESLTNELNDRGTRDAGARRKADPRPLVFLNACQSANIDPTAPASFPKLFLSKSLGFLGFIGTEATVPDWFGNMFAEIFYRHFVGGLQLGQALHAARWHMLKTRFNPQGILYTLYADPEIEVRNKVASLREKLPI
jgi:hypothetical protein